MREKFIIYSDECVEDFLKGNMASLFKNIKSLSTLVLQNFQPMIPDSFHDIWLQGIELTTTISSFVVQGEVVLC